MTRYDAKDWFHDEIAHLRSLERLTPSRRKMLAAYEKAAEALEASVREDIRPYWYGKLKEINNGQ